MPAAPPQPARDTTPLGTGFAQTTSMQIHRLHGISAYSHLIETDEALFLVDTGAPGHGGTILRAIREIGRRPDELRLAIVTHGHADHFGGIAELQAVADFPVAAHPAHAKTIGGGAILVSPGFGPVMRLYELFARVALPISNLQGARNVFSVADGERLDRFGLPGRILYTPGHSQGDISVILDDGSAFVGDTVQGRRIPGVTTPGLPGMGLDANAIVESWRKLMAAGITTIYPAHGGVLTVDELKPVVDRATARQLWTRGTLRG